jgi:hypothetical protein
MIGDGDSQDYDYISKQDAVAFSRRRIIDLYKRFLVLMEDYRNNHKVNFDKLKIIFPDDVDAIDLADYFGEQQFAYARKRILDLGNDALRELENDIKNIV